MYSVRFREISTENIYSNQLLLATFQTIFFWNKDWLLILKGIPCGFGFTDIHSILCICSRMIIFLHFLGMIYSTKNINRNTYVPFNKFVTFTLVKYLHQNSVANYFTLLRTQRFNYEESGISNQLVIPLTRLQSMICFDCCFLIKHSCILNFNTCLLSICFPILCC